MHYKVRVFVGKEAEGEGWIYHEIREVVELRNNFEKIQIKIIDDKVTTEIIGDGKVIIVRGDKSARLMNKTEGLVNIGDVIWLLSTKAMEEYNTGKRETFLGAALKIEFHNLEPVKRQEIFVNEKTFFQEKNNKKVNFILGFIVLGMLILGTFFGYQKRTALKQKEIFEGIKTGVEIKIAEIKSVRTVNIETALELAQNAEMLVNNPGIAEKKYLNELSLLKKQIEEIKQSLGGENVSYEVAYDSALISEGNDIFQGIATKDNIFYLWSATLGQINVVDPSLKSTEKIVQDDRIKTWLGIFNNVEKWYGYNSGKLFEIKRNDLVESEIKSTGLVLEMVGWNGLTYYLDNGIQGIMKLGGVESKSWLKEGTKLDEEAKSLNIDSKIWVLGNSGKIYQYNRGVKENFPMSFLPIVNSVKSLRTSDKVDFLAYIIDDNVVVIYGKDGKILGKYNFSETKINDIGIESQNKAVLVLAKNGKIYRIKIK